MNKSLTNYILIILLALICCFIGCRADIKRGPIEKDGKLYGVTHGLFRSKWWNYYERGVSFLDGEFWHEAEADFREALKMWNKDKRRIRTYGRHLTDYFPHRELGVVLFHQKQYPEAIEELKASLSTEKSARAEYYLDRARKIWIEQENLDTGPPIVFIESPGQGLVSNRFSVTVTGMATDDTFVKEIQINNKIVRIDLAGPQIPFHMELPVKAGENAVHIEVRDLTGKTTRTVRKLICDRAGPTLNIDELIPVHSKEGYVIRGYAHDDSGIREIRVNGRNILKNPAREVMLNHPVILSYGQKKALVVAEDQAGNQTRAQISPSNQGTDIWPYYSKSGNVLLASLDSSPSGICYAMNRGFMTPKKKIGKYETLGKYFALIIGINQYSEWPPLKNAVHDAATLRDVLITRYAFLQENILFRTDKDATWDRLIHDLRYMAGGLDENDNLLIYFSGHGQLDTINGDGYWVPADGRPGDPTTWITNSAIRNIVCSGDVRGKNIMIIADSCYSGTLLRGEPSPTVRRDIQETRAQPDRKKADQVTTSDTKVLLRGDSGAGFVINDYQERILKLAYRNSRQVITSGGMELVIDSDKKGDNHSLFAYYFLKALKENEHRIIDMEYLFHTKVWGPVAEKGGQRPVVVV